MTRELTSANVEAFTDSGELAVMDLVLVCVSGTPVWTSHTGILVTWVGGSAPTLTNTANHYDVIRLTRLQAGTSVFIGHHVVVDATIAVS